VSTTTNEPMTEARLQTVVALLDDQEYAGRGATRIDKQDLADLVNEVLRLRSERFQDDMRFAWLEWVLKDTTPKAMKAWVDFAALVRGGVGLVMAIDHLRDKKRSKSQ